MIVTNIDTIFSICNQLDLPCSNQYQEGYDLILFYFNYDNNLEIFIENIFNTILTDDMALLFLNYQKTKFKSREQFQGFKLSIPSYKIYKQKVIDVQE